jgi:hypothetical protein
MFNWGKLFGLPIIFQIIEFKTAFVDLNVGGELGVKLDSQLDSRLNSGDQKGAAICHFSSIYSGFWWFIVIVKNSGNNHLKMVLPL